METRVEILRVHIGIGSSTTILTGNYRLLQWGFNSTATFCRCSSHKGCYSLNL